MHKDLKNDLGLDGKTEWLHTASSRAYASSIDNASGRPCPRLSSWIHCLIWVLLILGLELIGEFLVRRTVSLAYAGRFPVDAVNRLVSGQNIHPLSHYCSYFLYLYHTVFALLATAVAYYAVTRQTAFSKRFRGLSMFLEAITISIFSIFIFAQLASRTVNFYDEGFILTGAWQFSHGGIPYRDFYCIYGPGQIIVLGSLFSLFGKSLLIARLYDLSVRVGITLVVWGILRPHLKPVSRFLAHLATICWIYRFGCLLYPLYPTLLFQLAAIFVLLLPALRLHPFPRYFCAGLLAGSAILFRHDLGPLFAVLVFAVLWIPAVVPDDWQSRPRPPVSFLLGVFPIPLLVYGAFCFLVPFSVLWRQLVHVAFFVIPSYRFLPYPRLADLFHSPAQTAPFYLFPAIFFICLAFVLWHAARTRTASHSQRAIFLLATLAITGIPQALGRSDLPHLLPFSIPIIPLFFLALSQSKRAIVLATLFLVWSAFYVYNPIVNRFLRPQPFAPMPGALVPVQNAIRSSSPGPIFVGNRCHDSLCMSLPSFYFLLDRLPCSYYYYFDPGVITTAPVQTEIIHELEEKSIQTLILWDEPPNHEANRSSEDSLARILDPWIREHFRLIVDLSPYSVWERKPVLEHDIR